MFISRNRPDHGLPDAQDLFKCLIGLKDPDDPGDRSQDTRLLAIRDVLLRRFRKKATVTMASGMGLKRAQLPVEAKDGPRDQCFLLEKTGIVKKEPCREIVASVETKIVTP